MQFHIRKTPITPLIISIPHAGSYYPKEFLKYKYILSVEGNDKDSGINWNLNSNSVVLMFRCHGTIMQYFSVWRNFNYLGE